MREDPDLVELTGARSSIEAEWIAGALRESGVPAVTFGMGLADEFAMSQRLLGSSGGLRVMVRREDLERARSLHAELRRARPPDPRSEPGPPGAGAPTAASDGGEAPPASPPDGPRTVLVFALSAAVLALACVAFLLYGRLSDLEKANPVIAWTWRGDGWEGRWRDSGRLAMILVDRDGNGVYEDSWVHDREGFLVYRFVDANQNEVSELTIDYDREGLERARTVDANENRLPERVEYAPRDGVQERWIDADEDRRFERQEFVDPSEDVLLDAFEDGGREGFRRVRTLK